MYCIELPTIQHALMAGGIIVGLALLYRIQRRREDEAAYFARLAEMQSDEPRRR